MTLARNFSLFLPFTFLLLIIFSLNAEGKTLHTVKKFQLIDTENGIILAKCKQNNPIKKKACQVKEAAEKKARQAREKAEAAKRRAEEEARRRAAEAKKRAEEEARRRAAEAKKRAEDEARRRAAEAKKRAEEAAKKAAAVKKRAEEAAKKAAATKKQKKPSKASAASAGAISGTTSTPKKRVLSYNKEQSTSVRKCTKIVGKKFCIGPKGKIGAGVKGKMSVATIAKASTGEVGALLSAKQIFTVKLFGRDVKIGAKCMFSSGAKTTFSHTFGYNFSTPPIPSVSASDILEAVVTRGKSAKKGAMRGARKTASIRKGDPNNPAGGYAGEATDNQFKKLMSAAASGCEIVVKPNPQVFKGIPAVNLFDAGITITMAAQNWKINQKTGKASVKLVAMAFGKLKVGNEKVKVAGKKFKIKGFTFNKKIANLVSMGIST